MKSIDIIHRKMYTCSTILPIYMFIKVFFYMSLCEPYRTHTIYVVMAKKNKQSHPSTYFCLGIAMQNSPFL